MGKKKNRSKNKNLSRKQQLDSGEVQETSSNVMEENNQAEDYDVLKVEYPTHGQVNIVQCGESYKGASMVENLNPNTNTRSVDIPSNEMINKGEPSEGNNSSTIECLDQDHKPITGQQPVSISSEENGGDEKSGTNEELSHPIVEENKTSMENFREIKIEPLKSNSGDISSSSMKIDDENMVLPTLNDQVPDVVNLCPIDDSKLSLGDEKLLRTSERVTQSPQSTVNNELPDGILEMAKANCSAPDVLNIREDKEIERVMELIESGTESFVKEPRLNNDTNSNKSAMGAQEIPKPDGTQQERSKDGDTVAECQEIDTQMASSEKATECVDNIGTALVEALGEQKMASSKETKAENQPQKTNSDLIETTCSNEKTETTERYVGKDSKTEKHQRKDNKVLTKAEVQQQKTTSDLIEATQSNEKTETLDRYVGKDSKTEKHQKKGNKGSTKAGVQHQRTTSDLIETTQSNEKTETIERNVGKDSKTEKHQKKGNKGLTNAEVQQQKTNSGVIETTCTNEKTETIERNVGKDSKTEKHQKKGNKGSTKAGVQHQRTTSDLIETTQSNEKTETIERNVCGNSKTEKHHKKNNKDSTATISCNQREAAIDGKAKIYTEVENQDTKDSSDLTLAISSTGKAEAIDGLAKIYSEAEKQEKKGKSDLMPTRSSSTTAEPIDYNYKAENQEKMEVSMNSNVNTGATVGLIKKDSEAESYQIKENSKLLLTRSSSEKSEAIDTQGVHNYALGKLENKDISASMGTKNSNEEAGTTDGPRKSDSEAKKQEKKDNSDATSKRGRIEKAEPIDTRSLQNSNLENQQNKDANEPVVPMSSSEPAETNNGLVKTDIATENQKNKDNSDLILKRCSNEKAEPMDSKIIHNSEAEIQDEKGKSDLELMINSNEIPETTDGWVKIDSEAENHQNMNNSDFKLLRTSNEIDKEVDMQGVQNSELKNQEKDKSDLELARNSNEKAGTTDGEVKSNSKEESQEKKDDNYLILQKSSNEKTELIDRKANHNFKAENQEKKEKNDLELTMKSSEQVGTIDVQVKTGNESGNQGKKVNSDLKLALPIQKKDEATGMKGVKNSELKNQEMKNGNDSMLTRSGNKKDEITDKQFQIDSTVETHKKKDNSEFKETMRGDEKTEVIERPLGEVSGLDSTMKPSAPHVVQLSTKVSDKNDTNLKGKKKKEKQMKVSSPKDTAEKGPVSGFTSTLQNVNQAEEKNSTGPATMGANLPLEALMKPTVQNERHVNPSEINMSLQDKVSNASISPGLSTVGNVNEGAKTQCHRCEEKKELGSDTQLVETQILNSSKVETDLGTGEKSPKDDLSNVVATKKKPDKGKRKGALRKDEGKSCAGTHAPECEQTTESVKNGDAGVIKKESESGTACEGGPGTLFAKDDDEAFQARAIFMANTCHVCKSIHGGATRLKSCSACRLIAYCCKEHQRTHWKEHKALCQLVQKKIKKSGLQDLYGEAYKITDAEEWRKFRCYQIVDVEQHMGRPLEPFEREMFLYPRVCIVCRKSDPEKLKVCKECHFINFCTSEHLPISHKIWCKDLKLLLQLNQYQSQYGLIRPNIPNLHLEHTKPFPKSMKDLFSISLRGYQNAAHFNLFEAALSDIATCPLTICYALNLLYGENRTDICKKMTVHLVGAENQFEVEPLSKWDSFLLNVLPDITELHIVFIGPELSPTMTDEVSGDNYQKLEIKTINSSKKLTAEFYYGQLYHDYSNSSSFKQPDIICAFNCGIYRVTGFNNQDTWGPTIKSMVKDINIPVLLTAYTEVEAPKDVARFRQQCDTKELITPMKNPFASMRPNLNFVSDDETPLIYKNQFLSVVKGN
ncbi:myb-like protein X [Hetaerina americana]|uniref:myb-like protein X n=1 Tax=Hetaerina americana TaxID=62018 RepID=UPI003A7F5E09